jgi:DNA-binding response OmpR family regulator
MPKILFVEDDSYLVRIYQSKLKEEGYVTEILEDGSKVMETLAKFKPDIIVLDLMLPIKSGFDILRELEQDPVFKKIPVLVVSKIEGENDAEKVRAISPKAKFLSKYEISIFGLIDEIKKASSQLY